MLRMRGINLLTTLALALGLASCSNGPVKVDGGRIQGVVSSNKDVIVYKGIPYAAPPVGELRWKAPAPVIPWEGVKVCDTFSNAAIQAGNEPGSFYWHEYYTEGDAPFSEDCLYLNVWAPRKPKNCPVAIWFHGGAFQSGWSFEKEFDGDEWAKRGVILVTVNYRLGPFGYMRHPLVDAECPEAAGNYGTLDQIESIKWVKRNIAALGGDPDNVTIFGQSAGAMSVMNICTSPKAKGLFNKAIIQSGGPCSPYAALFDIMDVEKASAISSMAMSSVGLNNLEEMYAADPSTILSSVDSVRKVTNSPFVFWPSINDAVLPKKFAEALADGSIADVPYIVGGTKDDLLRFGEGFEGFAEIRSKQSSNPVFTYKFNRELPGDIPAGAFHSAELWYVFGTLSRSSRPFVEADYDLCRKMLDCWTSFAKTGDPQNGWNRWSEGEDNTMIFDIDE